MNLARALSGASSGGSREIRVTISGLGGDPFAPLALSAASAGRAVSGSLGGVTRILIDIHQHAGGAAGGVLRLAGSLYVLERAGAAIARALVDPFKNATRAMLEATEQSKLFNLSVGAVVGGLDRARLLNQEFFRSSQHLPQTISQLREAATALAFSPALSGRVSLATGIDAVRDRAAEYSSMIQRLTLVDPHQGQIGAAISLREMAEGGEASLLSLRRRFGVTSRTLARELARDFGGDMTRAMEAVQNQPGMALQGLDRFLASMIPPDAEQQIGRLLSVRVEKIREQVRHGLSKIGEAGIFDQAVAKLEGFGKALFAHLDSPAFEAQAARISSSLSRTLENVSKAVVGFLAKLTGTSGATDTVAGVVEVAATAMERLAGASGALPALAEGFGGFLNSLRKSVDEASAQIARLGNNLAAYQQEAPQVARRASGMRYPADMENTQTALANLLTRRTSCARGSATRRPLRVPTTCR